MYKQFYSKLLLLVAMIVAGAGSSWAATYKLTKVTSVEAGGLYVFEQDGHVMNNTVSSSALQTTDSYSKTNLTGTETYVWTLETGDTNGCFYMKNVSVNDGYLYNGSSTGVSLSQNHSNWKFNFQDDETVLIQNSNNSNRFLGYSSNTSYAYKAYATSNIDSYPHAIVVYKLEEENGDTPSLTASDLSLTGTTNALSFDLFNNSDAQVLNYSTSSTGAVTVSENAYVTTIVDEANKTITVTPVAITPSEQTLTISQAADNNYAAGSVRFTVNITNNDPNAPGTANNPYTVTQARAAIDANAGVTGVYAKGIVSKIVTAFNSQYGNISYNISEDGTEEADQLEAYRGFSYNGEWFTSADDIQVGDEVVIYGNLKKYNSTYEFDANNQLVSLVRPQASQDPVISAENVSIAYDATEGTISYTLNNPVDNGKLTATTNANWLTLGTVGETIPFTTTANDAAAEREAIVTLTYSYDNKTATKEVKVTQAGNPNIVMTIAEVRAQATGDVVTKGVVTSCVGKTAYIQDETAAICVYGSSNLELNKGEEVKVSGSLSTYNGLLEITSPTCEVLSSDNNVTATVKTIEEINNDYAEGNTLQGLLVKIENATVTVINGQNTTIAQGENTIVVRGISSDVEYAVDDVLTLTGNIGCYNAAQIANPTDVEVQEVETAKYYLAGSWDNGSWQNGMVEFESKGNGVYTLTKTLEANVEFKVVDENNNWYSAETPNLTKPCESIALSSSNQGNMKIELAGNYTFRLDVTANGTFLTVEGWPEAGYYLVGSWGELPWTAIESNKFAESEEGGIYTINKTLAGGETFKVLYVNDNANPTWYGGDTQGANPPYVIHSEHHEVNLTAGDAGSDFAIYEAGNYTFTVNTTGTAFMLNVTGWVEPIEGKAFVKVTSTDDITNGQYLIVYEDANIAFDGSLETLDAVGNTLDVTIVDDKIAATEETLAAVFTVDVNNGTLKSASGKYIGVSSNSNGLKTSDNASTYTHTFSIDDEGNAVISAVFEGSTMTLRFNKASNQNRFRYYKSGQEAIQLYKYNVPTVTIGEAQWATYVAVDNVEFPEGVTAYIPVQVNEGQTAVMIQSVSAVKKGEPVILNGEAGTYELSIADAETELADLDNMFIVADGTDVSDGTFYMLSYKNEKVGFRKVQDEVTIPAGKPYIVIVNAAKEFIPFGGGEATGIESFETVGFDVNAPIYDMQGRQVQKLQKGIFIQNGKKLIVK